MEGLKILLEDVYSSNRKYLFRIAYRMLGTVADAEDIVQEVFVSLSRHDWSQVLNVKSFLVKTTINRCINFLQSSSRRREQYLGPWLPEPILDSVEEQPEKAAERDEQVRYGLIVMLQLLTPQERALFIMKDILGYGYGEIAEMLDRTESNCRKIFSRAKQKMNQSPHKLIYTAGEETEVFAKRFIHAIQTGDYEDLVRYMRDEVTLITDGGGKTKAAYRPIFGIKRVLAFLRGVSAKGAYDGELNLVRLNGETGIRLIRQGRIVSTICFQFDLPLMKISHIYIVLNPEKLRAVN